MSDKNTTLSPELAIDALAQAPQGVIICGKDQSVQWANQTLATWLDTSTADLVGGDYASFLQRHFRNPSENPPDMFTAIGSGDSPLRWVRRTAISLDQAGQAIFFSDVSEEQKLRERLDQLEIIEPVSRLLNRRAMLQNLDPLISRSRRYENPLTVIAMELLNLEGILADYGEAAANHAILELSHLLKDQLRWADIISRTDDNHIVIILPETNKEDAGHLAEKINTQVAELQIQYESTPTLHLAACFGVAAWEKGNDSLLLLRNANQALVKARGQGKGSIEIA